MSIDNQNPNELFSDDPEENLRIENEILKLKMQAQSGATFGGDSDGLPPEIENQFLMQVMQFEEAWKNVKFVKVHELIGKPAFKNYQQIPKENMQQEIDNFLQLLKKHNMNLNVEGEYEPVVIYRFITEELFEHETDDLQMEGILKNFVYEEFHPNHKLEIENVAKKFLEYWFEKSFDETSWELADTFILPDSTFLSKDKFLKKLDAVLSCYTAFTNCKFIIPDVSFEWNEASGGMGFAEGSVKYDAEMENHEVINIEGPFKLYMSNQDGNWQIFYFVFPGFGW